MVLSLSFRLIIYNESFSVFLLTHSLTPDTPYLQISLYIRTNSNSISIHKESESESESEREEERDLLAVCQ